MIGAPLGEKEVGIGGEIEVAGVAIAVGKLNEQLAGIVGAQSLDHARNLAGPGGVSLAAFHQLVQMAAPRGELAERFKILSRQIGLWSASFAARREIDAAEDAASVAGIRNAAE